ncbi:MAG: zinc ribbon domain-containing protein [Anaerolineae bacterium]
MKTTQLKCPACGSTDLEKLRWNEYRCSHCESGLKLDSEGKNLELVGWACPECGFGNSVGQRFCSQCGTNLSKHCPLCRTENHFNVRYCGSCGFGFFDADGFIGLGKSALKQRRLNQARAYFEQAMALDATNLEARAGLVQLAEIKKREENRDRLWHAIILMVFGSTFTCLLAAEPSVALALGGAATLAVLWWLFKMKRRAQWH